jgi:hypothetical protein
MLYYEVQYQHIKRGHVTFVVYLTIKKEGIRFYLYAHSKINTL